jgi:hypothetical protein
MNLKTAFLMLSCIWTLLPFQGSASNGYQALTSCEDGFLAAGSGGRLDWISAHGVVLKSVQVSPFELNALLSINQSVVAAGDSGTLLISTNKSTFQKIDVGTNASIFSLARFNHKILAGSEQGLLLLGADNGPFQQLPLALEGNIVSLSANNTDCFGVTDKGEIIHSTDGTQWKILDFNTYYAGYYKPCRFNSILVTETEIAVAGAYDDGTPALFLSTEGTIWAERSLNYTGNQGEMCYLAEIPSSMLYDALQDQILLVCSKGKVMVIPACSHCNRLQTVSTENLRGLSENGGNWLVVGENFKIHLLEVGWK